MMVPCFAGVTPLAEHVATGLYRIPYAIPIDASLGRTLLLLTLRIASYFGFGALVKYLVNILRIVSIYLVAIDGGNVDFFRSTYDPLYPIAWIMSCPLIIVGSRSVWIRFKNQRHGNKLNNLALMFFPQRTKEREKIHRASYSSRFFQRGRRPKNSRLRSRLWFRCLQNNGGVSSCCL